ncbi:thiol reductant ABC exporter subunit CydD [Streptomyces demainii]|uniref:ATP-binding cassette subfamily C protein CydCD n=1 Tax=Streptomyces demainii TaxID=588122 RepID=A0ABT9KK37_9ACTN|nr:thiol reductant ABC exporter subunit CydD [Streptomyces demainii]MDP9608770.1 ATP-binding cassette subfamily C protein CydCD [Streptomyces demainii]
MKPIDPRLLRYARATRFFLAASVALGLVGAGLVIAQAMLIAEIVVGAFQRGDGAGALTLPLGLLALVALGRAVVSWLTELAAHRASAAVKSELRLRLLERAVRLGPSWLDSQRTGALTTLATRGIDALDDYFARYLPQLGLAVVVPVAVLARIVTADWISALIIVVTLPLIPLFMVLIGWATQSRMDRQWRLLSRLSGHFLDVVAGLPTLKVFGRAKAQAASIRAITADYRRATLKTLRLAFLSSFALELLATVSVALVAVDIGMRLVHGEMDLFTGLMVLVLAPEAYLPLRQVGAQYHAAAEGLAAADEVFAVLERALPSSAADGSPAPDARGAALTLDGLMVRHPGRTAPSLARTSFEIRPGETVAVVGPSGAGKSTLLNAVLGFAVPDQGRVLIGGRDLASLDPESWRRQIAWVPQRPYLFAGTIAENVRLARPDADDEAVRAALRDADAHRFVSALPDGIETRLGEMGAGLSAGQRQRIALARAFLADRPVLLLDEPTANLDGETEASVVEAVRRLAEGRTVLLVVHRPALLPLADRVLRLPGPTASPLPASGGGSGRVSVAGARAGATGAGAIRNPRAEAPVSATAGVGAGVGDAGAGAGGAAGGVGDADADSAAGGVGDADTDAGPGGLAAAPAGVGHEPMAGVVSGVGHESMAGAASRAGHESSADVGSGERPVGAWAGRGSGSAGRTVSRGPRAHAGPGALARVRAAARGTRGRFALALLLGSLALVSAVGLMAVSGWLISRAAQQPPVLYLMVAVTATRAFGIGRAAFRYAERLVSHDAVLRVLADLRVAVYRRLERLAPAGLGRTRRGDLLSRLVADVDTVQDYFLRWLLPVGSALTVSVASVGFLTWVLPGAGAVLAAGLLVAGVGVPLVSGALARRAERRLAPARGALSAQVVDLLAGTAELTVAGALPRRLDALRRADGALTRIARRAAAATGAGAGLSALVCGLTVTAAAWLGVSAVADGRIHGVWLAVVVLTPLAAFEAVAGLPLAVQHRQRVRRAAERVYEVMDEPLPVREPGQARVVEPQCGRGRREESRGGQARVAESGGCRAWGEESRGGQGRREESRGCQAWGGESRGGRAWGEESRGCQGRCGEADGEETWGEEPPDTPYPLVLRGITARHPGQAAPALDGFGLELRPGHRVAVVGPSGAGKTTLAQVLLRFLDAEGGTYTLGGRNAAALDGDAVRRLVGLCAQDAHVFDSSLRENLRLARTGASDGELRAALAEARLLDWVDGLPDGLDTLVGEQGARLSGGQRQRLALARALLADFPVLVLDEPAEHLDLPTADALTADLLSATRGRTTVLITHRLAGLDAVDEVIVLDGGRAVQRGTYRELAAADGPFRRMLEREAAEGGILVGAGQSADG